MKRVHYAILMGEALSYALIIVFIFADAMFDLTGVFRPEQVSLSPPVAYIAACLVGIVGSINLWLTWYYMQKANTMRDWLIVCAWTHRIKHNGRWLTLEEFLTEHHGYQVSHGLSEASLLTMRDEVDTRWRSFPVPAPIDVKRPDAPRENPTSANVAPTPATDQSTSV